VISSLILARCYPTLYAVALPAYTYVPIGAACGYGKAGQCGFQLRWTDTLCVMTMCIARAVIGLGLGQEAIVAREKMPSCVRRDFMKSWSRSRRAASRTGHSRGGCHHCPATITPRALSRSRPMRISPKTSRYSNCLRRARARRIADRPLPMSVRPKAAANATGLTRITSISSIPRQRNFYMVASWSKAGPLILSA